MQTDTVITAQEETLYDYLVVVNPDGQTARHVQKFKEQIAETLGIFNSRYSKAHITLFRSVFPEKYQQDFIDLLNEVTRRQSAFTVYTSKFDHFRHGEHKRTIYINVANPKPLAELRNRILQVLGLRPGDFKPHITLARSISTEEFNKVYPFFDQQLFVRSFSCRHFLLLRKPAAGGAYEVVKTFSFGAETQRQRSFFNHAA